jgi:hypothetical protein
MDRGDVVCLSASPAYAFGQDGSADGAVHPDAHVVYFLELVRWGETDVCPNGECLVTYLKPGESPLDDIEGSSRPTEIKGCVPTI